MSLILNGTPRPRLELRRAGLVVDDFVLENFEAGQDAPTYLVFEPDIVRHELQDGTVLTKLRGFRMRCELFWPQVAGEEIQKLRRLLDRRAYDEAWLYPWSTDKPFYREKVTIDDESLQLAYFYLLKQRDFTLKLVSTRLLDYVPLEDADFLSWGNITLQFFDLSMAFADFERRVTVQSTNSRSVIASTHGYFRQGTAESVGGSVTGTFGEFWTDLTTVCTFEIADADFPFFTGWQINGQAAGNSQRLSISVLQNIAITAQFSG